MDYPEKLFKVKWWGFEQPGLVGDVLTHGRRRWN